MYYIIVSDSGSTMSVKHAWWASKGGWHVNPAQRSVFSESPQDPSRIKCSQQWCNVLWFKFSIVSILHSTPRYINVSYRLMSCHHIQIILNTASKGPEFMKWSSTKTEFCSGEQCSYLPVSLGRVARLRAKHVRVIYIYIIHVNTHVRIHIHRYINDIWYIYYILIHDQTRKHLVLKDTPPPPGPSTK